MMGYRSRKDLMADRRSLDEGGYILYSDLIDRLRARFPHVPHWRLEQVVTAENDAITGGILRIVPVEVEDGTVEMLEREAPEAPARGASDADDDDEVA